MARNKWLAEASEKKNLTWSGQHKSEDWHLEYEWQTQEKEKILQYSAIMYVKGF